MGIVERPRKPGPAGTATLARMDNIWYEVRCIVRVPKYPATSGWDVKICALRPKDADDLTECMRIIKKLRKFVIEKLRHDQEYPQGHNRHPGRRFLQSFTGHSEPITLLDIVGVYRVTVQSSRIQAHRKDLYPLDPAKTDKVIKKSARLVRAAGSW